VLIPQAELQYLIIFLLFYQILLIREAKLKGLQVTCEVCPHHLFLCQDDKVGEGFGWNEVRPKLCTREDQNALWDNLDYVDCFATDHGECMLHILYLNQCIESDASLYFGGGVCCVKLLAGYCKVNPGLIG